MYTLAGAGTGTTLYRDTYMLRFGENTTHAADATEQSVKEAAQFQRTRRGRWLGVYA